VLWLTNDLPPRTGGIQQFVANLLERVHTRSTLVVGPGGDAEALAYDRDQRYRTVRGPGKLLPTPTVRRLALEIGREHRPDVIVIGALWPLGELGASLRRQLGVPVVALSHGFEAGLAKIGLGPVIGHASRSLDAITTVSDWAESHLQRHVRGARLVRVPPGVDVHRFTPQTDGSRLRERWGIPPEALVVGCVSRLVRRKGQDVLLAAWPEIRRRHPDAWLVMVGEGPLQDMLDRRAGRQGPDRQVVIAGPVPWDDLPATYAALDVFAMPVRTRLAGLDVEGLGIVYLEAAATGVPTVAGQSGGAPEAVLDGVTGTVIDGEDRSALIHALDAWLVNPEARAAAGVAAREWAQQRWSWEAIATRFSTLLEEVVATSTASEGATD